MIRDDEMSPLTYFKAAATVDPRSAGVSTQRIPATLIAAYLSFAVPLSAADDRASVTHAASGRRGLPRDKSDHRFLHVRLDIRGRGFFGIAADFADQDDRRSLRIVVKHLDSVQERSADNGIAADANAGGLPDSQARKLVYRFISERAAAADHANISLLVNAPRHDSDLALSRRDDSGAVRTDKPRLFAIHRQRNANHVPAPEFLR